MSHAEGLRRHIEEAAAAKKAGGLPPSALEVLQAVGESFTDKPIRGEVVKKLDPFNVRRAMATAKKGAANQVPAVVYEPGGPGDPLVILKAEDLAELLRTVEIRGGTYE